jgi:hypothetical protein
MFWDSAAPQKSKSYDKSQHSKKALAALRLCVRLSSCSVSYVSAAAAMAMMPASAVAMMTTAAAAALCDRLTAACIAARHVVAVRHPFAWGLRHRRLFHWCLAHRRLAHRGLAWSGSQGTGGAEHHEHETQGKLRFHWRVSRRKVKEKHCQPKRPVVLATSLANAAKPPSVGRTLVHSPGLLR